ncbi:MAG: hypothetical protein RLZZ381_637 [Cyanobacteriota bacterium]|jgi:hypothetical protein
MEINTQYPVHIAEYIEQSNQWSLENVVIRLSDRRSHQ